jgi:Predicted nucleoside-diphosphate-sugar epimerases
MLCRPPLNTEIALHDTLSLPLGNARIAYVDAQDVAAVLFRALIDPSLVSRTFDVSGPQALTHRDC